MARSRIAAPPDDYLYRQRLTYRQNRHELHFDIAEGLFSAATIDEGTRYLLRWLGGPATHPVRSVLDLGCGYGPIGITLAAFNADRSVLCTDRDALAVEYSAWNAKLNGLDDRVQAMASVGLDDVPVGRQFDLVVSNIPAKVGPSALAEFLFGGVPWLSDGGRIAVVVIDRIRPMVDEYLESASCEVLDRHDNRRYGVRVFRPTGMVIAPKDDPYDRGPARRFEFEGTSWTVVPTFTLPEFDTLSYSTQLALSLLPNGSTRYVVAGVGHGHIPTFLSVRAPLVPLCMVDRDLLALRVAQDTLTRLDREVSVEVRHASRPSDVERTGEDCVVVRLDKREPVAVTAETVRRLAASAKGRGTTIIHGRTADVVRVLNVVRISAKLEVSKEVRNRGHAAAQLSA
ncbi:MAG TPA: methyltransferase [Actinomycetota bacterium]|nr:methyltransferase [Actinomycetota bacterium]